MKKTNKNRQIIALIMAATVGLIVVLSLIMIFSLIANACGSGKTDAEHKPTTDIQTMANIAESGITKVPKEHLVSIGKYKLTAYCPCEHCCDKWGKDRPKDKDGKPIVITASGEIANQGITVAADTSVLPFGTRIQIDGCEYIVQDRGGSALIYDGDIAERLCCPSELKKTRNGERNPNSRETWLDVQARALRQACRRIKSAARF